MEYKSISQIAKFHIGSVASGQQIKEFVTEFMKEFGGMYWLDDDSVDDYQMLQEEAYDLVLDRFGEFAGVNTDEDTGETIEVESHAEEFLDAVDDFMQKKIGEFWTTICGF